MFLRYFLINTIVNTADFFIIFRKDIYGFIKHSNGFLGLAGFFIPLCRSSIVLNRTGRLDFDQLSKMLDNQLVISKLLDQNRSG